MRECEILVIGGGIGGLTAAIAVRKLGFRAAVFEQAPRFQNLGGGLVLHSNGQRVLAALGLLIAMEPRLHATQVINIERAGASTLSTFDYRSLAVPYNRCAILLRHELLAFLLTAAERLGIPVYYGWRADGLKTTASETEVSFSNGRTAAGPVVIGADGVHSEMRRHAGLRAATGRPGEAHLRGISISGLHDTEIHELWSANGRRFGYAPLPRGKVYFYCSPLGRWPFRDPREFDQWKGSWFEFGPNVRDLVGNVPDWSAVNYSEVTEIETRRWSEPPVFLVGDAAHGMTPDLGQGANSAMVDALVLARLLRKENSLNTIAQEYHRLRFEFTTKVQRASRRVGWLAKQHSPVMRFLTDRALRSVATLPRLTREQRLLAAGWNPAENDRLTPL